MLICIYIVKRIFTRNAHKKVYMFYGNQNFNDILNVCFDVCLKRSADLDNT